MLVGGRGVYVMFKRLLTLTIAILGSAGLALASEPECPPITVVVPTAVHYTVQQCLSYGLLPGVPSGCLNCPGEEAHVFNQTHPVCVQGYRDYETRTVQRHLVNGRCVPVEIALRERTVPAPRIQQPIVAAPPLHAAPPMHGAPPIRTAPIAGPRVGAPPMQAPPIERTPAMQSPHIAPPPPPPAHAVPQGGRPQP